MLLLLLLLLLVLVLLVLLLVLVLLVLKSPWAWNRRSSRAFAESSLVNALRLGLGVSSVLFVWIHCDGLVNNRQAVVEDVGDDFLGPGGSPRLWVEGGVGVGSVGALLSLRRGRVRVRALLRL